MIQPNVNTATSTRHLIKENKSSNEDYEWYPTTSEIINTIRNDINGEFYDNSPSILWWTPICRPYLSL